METDRSVLKHFTSRYKAHDDADQANMPLNSWHKESVAMCLLMLLSLAVTNSLFFVCWWMFYPGITSSFMNASSTPMIWMLYSILTIGLSRTCHAFDVGIMNVSELVFSHFLSQLMSAAMVYMVTSFCWAHFLNLLPLLGLILVQTLWNTAWGLMANKYYFHIHPPQKTVIIYRRESDLHRLEQIKYFSDKFDVKKYIKDPGDIHQLICEVKGYAAIFVLGVNAALRNGIAKYCISNDVQGYIAPHVGDIIMSGAKHMRVFGVPVMRINRASPSFSYLFAKRVFDIIFSLIGIVLTSPVMLITALAIKLYDGGPVLYKQLRITQDRREFMILKFRSMRVDAEKDGVARLAGDNDDRITPVGKVIRAIRLDELPQLFNIIRGSMTIVGPRPERPEIAAQYEKLIPAFSLRLQVKAGLTGYAQIYGKYNTEPYDKLQMDLIYINNMSMVEDLRLMIATAKVLLMKDSTEGIEKGKVTAIKEDAKVSGTESA